MIKRVSLLACAAVISTTAAASAASFDFSGVTTDAFVASPLDVGTATLTSATGTFLVDVDGSVPAFCASSATGNVNDPVSCANDFTVDFTNQGGVTDLSFVIFDAPGDSNQDRVRISVFDLGGIEIATGDINGADLAGLGDIALFDFSFLGAARIGSISFNATENTTGEGFGYAQFSFAPVPLPAALPLMMLGLGALGVARSRKRKAA